MKPFLKHGYRVEAFYPYLGTQSGAKHGVYASFHSLLGARMFALMFSYWPGCEVYIVESIEVLR